MTDNGSHHCCVLMGSGGVHDLETKRFVGTVAVDEEATNENAFTRISRFVDLKQPAQVRTG